MTKIPEAIILGIANAKNIVLVTHVHPDGDALGATFGLRDVLENMGKKVLVFLEEPVSSLFTFLPGASRVHTDFADLRRFVEESRADLITVALDSGDDNRLGKYKDELLGLSPFMVIDHHKSHKDYGEYRWVEAGLSSTGEMVYELIQALGAELPHDAAINIYVAICTDTGSFRYESTKPRTLQIASDLVAAGVQPETVASQLYDNFSLQRLKLMELVLGTLQTYVDDQLAFIHVTREMLAHSGAELHEVEGFIDYPRSLKSVKVAAFLKEGGNGKVSVSLRAKGECDVAEIAKSFDGGGHRNAAGFSFQNLTVEAVRAKVLQALAAQINQ